MVGSVSQAEDDVAVIGKSVGDGNGKNSAPLQAQAHAESVPEWADPELSEEWISQPNSPIMSPKKASDTVSSRSTATSSGKGEGTTRILADKETSGGRNNAATPEWKKMSNPKDFFSPMTLERMFQPNVGEISFTSSKLRSSKDTHSRLKASLSKLKSELDKVSPILGPMQPLKENRLITVRNPAMARHDVKNRVVSSQDTKENRPEPPSIIDEEGSENENGNAYATGTNTNNIEPATVSSPHPPQKKDFNFTVTKTTGMAMAEPFSESKLKIFQPRDTYTKSKFEGLIDHGSDTDDEAISDQGRNEPEPEESVDVKPLSPSKERTPKRPRLELSKSHVTTQDFMSQAEHIMDMLRGLKKPASMHTDADYSQRQSEMTSVSQGQSEYESVSISPERRRKVSLKQIESDSAASKTTPSETPSHDENEGLDEDALRPHKDIYYDSIRNRYETSTTHLGAAVMARPQYKRSLTELVVNPHSPLPDAYGHQQSPRKATVQLYKPGQESPARKSYEAAQIRAKSPSKRAATPNIGHPTMSSNGSTKKSSNLAVQTEAMQVILKEQVEKYIPINFGSMVFDSQNHKWINRKKDPAESGDEDDIFNGIEDLTDNVADNYSGREESQLQNEDFIERYRNSLQRSLSSLVETVNQKSSGEPEVESPKSQIRQDMPNFRSQYRGRNTYQSTPRVTNETVQSTPLRTQQRKNFRPTTANLKPEVSFVLPQEEGQQSPYAADISYVKSRHDATAVSQLESSFSIAVQNLVKILSDIHPFEPYWQDITVLELQGRELETLVRLEEWCPQLLHLNVSENNLGHLTGVPESTRVLRAAHNNFSELTAFGFLSNLQYLDLSHNQLETLDGMSRLVHLREIIVDNNELVNIDGIMQLDGLLRLSVRGNKLETVNLENSNLTRIEDLDLSSNELQTISGLERLKNLILLNLDDNLLSSVYPDGYLLRLRTLKICRNRLEKFDAAAFPNLRILYLDDNQLERVSGLKKLRLLENLSVRDQHSTTNELWCPNLTDVRKLYLSGSRPQGLSFQQHFLNLQSLELASVQLKELPDKFSSFARNLRDLNLSFNELSDISNLKDIPKLRRLYLIGNQIKGMEHLASVIATFPGLQVLDMRMNPLTLSFYPPVLKLTDNATEKHTPAANSLGTQSLSSKGLHRQYNLVMSRQAQSTWENRDRQFESHLSRLTLMKRQAYHGLMFISAPSLLWLDGVSFTKDAVSEVGRILEKVTLNVERKDDGKKRRPAGRREEVERQQ
ncbi:hypothetical protein V1525DRAFT_457979 [Lipomyces kononenkoae]|uniref:Uncharacterized protein n=1 Tax=Lipomyces kononenkoae TaxID=34357 RepID=A0ACC3SWN8_LIPKO